MTNTLSSSFSGVIFSILAFLSQIFHFGCDVRHMRMALICILSNNVITCGSVPFLSFLEKSEILHFKLDSLLALYFVVGLCI